MRWIAYTLKIAIVMNYTVEAGSCHLLWYRIRIMPMTTTSRWSGNPQSQPFEIRFLQLKNNLTTVFLSGFVKKEPHRMTIKQTSSLQTFNAACKIYHTFNFDH